MATSKGMIKRPAGLDVTSKYTFEDSWTNSETGISTKTVFNINADVTVPVFNSTGAPKERTLDVTFDDKLQRVGYDTFTGSIGEGRIYIRTAKGVVIKGEIEGGPEEGQSFIGAGTWTKA